MEILIERMNLAHLDLMVFDEFDDFWNVNMLREELLSPTSVYFVAMHGDEVVRFCRD